MAQCQPLVLGPHNAFSFTFPDGFCFIAQPTRLFLLDVHPIAQNPIGPKPCIV